MNSTAGASEKINSDYRPRILRTEVSSDLELLQLLWNDEHVQKVDRYEHQRREFDRIVAVDATAVKLADRRKDDPKNEGVWVYYPWNKYLVHLLDEPAFVRVRTDRNRDKITSAEQALLSTKRIGIIGMSVGRSVATTMSLERIFGHLKLADFDTLDLSNLNRLNAPVYDLGLLKTHSVAREIAAMDPYLSIETYDDGATADNMEGFLLDGGKLDLLIDECDSMEVKLLCREAARKHGIPVVMETSDRGMLDIERFDLEPDRPIFHGLLNDVEWHGKPFTPELKGQLLMKIVAFDQLSLRARVSLAEIGKSLITWPQLASSVVLGGGTVTNTARKILLGEATASGRYYVDMDTIIGQ